MIQIRFADSPEQKHLKQATAAARQFRSEEYMHATRQLSSSDCGTLSPVQGRSWAQSALRRPLAPLRFGPNMQPQPESENHGGEVDAKVATPSSPAIAVSPTDSPKSG